MVYEEGNEINVFTEINRNNQIDNLPCVAKTKDALICLFNRFDPKSFSLESGKFARARVTKVMPKFLIIDFIEYLPFPEKQVIPVPLKSPAEALGLIENFIEQPTKKQLIGRAILNALLLTNGGELFRSTITKEVKKVTGHSDDGNTTHVLHSMISIGIIVPTYTKNGRTIHSVSLFIENDLEDEDD